jgi:hypothetical protein
MARPSVARYPQVIGLFDDVLTTGAYFRAASGVRIVGFFIARRVPEAADFGEFEL